MVMMSHDTNQTDRTTLAAQTALIVGCGYVGQRLAARLIELGTVVYGTTRSQKHGAMLAKIGVHPLLADVTQPLTLASLQPILACESLDVYYLVPPGRPNPASSPEQVIGEGLPCLLKALRTANVRRGVLTSSSAVYGQRDGQRVDAETIAEPADERGRLLLHGEQTWLEARDSHHVVRLAGLYGPGRVVGLKAVQDGAPLVGDPQAMLNLLHVDDAVDLLLAVMRASQPGRIELGCDGHPVPRLAYYNALADRLGVPRPAVLDDASATMQFGMATAARLRRTTSKSLDPTITRQRTGWVPRFANFHLGLDHALPA